MSGYYNLNSRVRISGLFTVVASGVPTDPTTTTLTITQPDGTVQTQSANLLHDGPGAYHFDQIVSQAGMWRYRWQGTGAVTAGSSLNSFWVV